MPLRLAAIELDAAAHTSWWQQAIIAAEKEAALG